MTPNLSSELLWIAVPGGLINSDDARHAVLRVLVVPRLQGSSLAGEGMASWPPPGLATATLAVEFGADAQHLSPPVPVAPPHVRAQPGLWEAFFGPATLLRPAVQPAAPAPVAVANTAGPAAAINATFGAAAATKVTPNPASHAALDKVVRKQLITNWSDDALPPPPGPAAAVPGAPPVPVDFHRSLSLLREHPAVLRALGLIIELRLPVAQLPAGRATGVVRVSWPGAPAPPALPVIVSPLTQYEFDGQYFLPASTPAISSGMVALTDPRIQPGGQLGKTGWEVVTVDVDAGARRLRDAARALAPNAAGAAPAAEQPRPTPLPPLRTAGLLLVRRGRQHDFDQRQQAAIANGPRPSMSTAVLTADDLVLGYRIDINRGGEWRSLHAREATYRVGALTVAAEQPFEEGHLKAQAAVRGQDGALRTDEVVARWSGWSLAVPPPLAGGASPGPPARRTGALPFDFDWVFNVKKGSLPRLQFTEAYQMRARVADIAGGGLDLPDAAAARCATASVVYRRYEPVASPELRLPEDLPASSLGPGEAVDVLLVRSDPAGDPSSPVATFLAQNPLYKPTARRALLPPAVALALAQQHPGALVGAADQTLAVLRAVAPAGPDGSLFGRNLALPDPAGEGIAAFARPAPGTAAQQPLLHAWSGLWPELTAGQLALVGAPGDAVAVAWAGEALTVALPPAEQLTLELSSFLRGDFLDHFAIKEQLPSASETTVLLGRHPLVTPARAVRFVHAVRRPLSKPAGTLTATREPGQPFALLNPAPSLTVHAKSTVKLEITAAWTEYSDEVTRPVTAAPVQSVGIGPADDALRGALRHEFGDTRHRMVSYTLTAVSRFRQFFRADEAADAFLSPALLPAVSVPSSARPVPPLVRSTYPTFRWERQPPLPGANTSRAVRRSGLRLELQRPWFQSGEGERLAVLVGPTNAPAALVQPFLTQVGRDPIWDTPTPDHWPTQQAIAPAGGAPAELLLADGTTAAVAVPHEVWFDNGRWYADVALPGVAAASYCPLVQLAVARYQPNSLAGLELSEVVHTEFVPLLPDRTLTVTQPEAGVVEVLLEGLGPAGPRPNRVDLIVEQSGQPAGAVELTALAPSPAEVPAWVLQSSVSGPLGTRLRGALPPPGAGALRVRIRETELIGPVEGAAQLGTEAELTERTVFADVVLLPLDA